MSPSYFVTLINSYLPEPHASLLNGILFGIPLRTTTHFYEELKQTGLLHLVVLSGMNITLLSSLIAPFVSLFSKKIALGCTLCCITLFILFVGPQPPIIRAGIMGGLSLISVWFGKKNTALISLMIAVVCIAIVWPSWINTISLWLSIGATLGLILFGNSFSDHTNKNILHYLRSEMILSLSAQIFTVPIICLSFKQISIISPFSNMCVSFLIGPLMIFGCITCILGSLSWYLGVPFAYLSYGILTYMVNLVHVLSAVPFSSIEF